MTTEKTTRLSEVSSSKGRAEKLTGQAEQLIAKVNKTIQKAADYRQESDFTQSDFTVEVFRMTPNLAKQILQYCNVSYGRSHGQGAASRQSLLEKVSGDIKFSKGFCTNRTRDERIVSRIKNEVLKDWFFEASNIAFNKKGMLIDGQHTLSFSSKNRCFPRQDYRATLEVFWSIANGRTRHKNKLQGEHCRNDSTKQGQQPWQ